MIKKVNCFLLFVLFYELLYPALWITVWEKKLIAWDN